MQHSSVTQLVNVWHHSHLVQGSNKWSQEQWASSNYVIGRSGFPWRTSFLIKIYSVILYVLWTFPAKEVFTQQYQFTILHQSYVIYQNQTCVKLAKWWLSQNNEDRIFLKTCIAISYLFYFMHLFSIAVIFAGNCLYGKKI